MIKAALRSIAFAGLALLLAAPGSPETGSGLKENLDLPFNAASSDTEEEEAPELFIFYGESYEADAVFFCLDQSLSMGDGEWRSLQRELGRVVTDFSSDMQFGIVFFHEQATVFPNDKRPVQATPGTKKQAISLVEATEASNRSTCFLEGLRAAFEMANRCPVKRKSIIFMSDGKATCVGTDSITYMQKTLDEVRGLNTSAIPIHAIGVGSEVVDHFLRILSEQSGGSFRRLRG